MAVEKSDLTEWFAENPRLMSMVWWSALVIIGNGPEITGGFSKSGP